MKVRQEELIYSFFRNRYHWYYANNLKEVREYTKDMEGRTYSLRHLVYKGMYIVATHDTLRQRFIIYDGWNTDIVGYRYLLNVIILCKKWMNNPRNNPAFPISLSKDCLTFSKGRSIPLKAKGIWQQII